MKMVKNLFIVICTILFLTLILTWILASVLSPEKFKPYLNQQLSYFAQQPSQIEGDITWRIFPKPGIKATKIIIGKNDPNAPYSLSLNELQLNLKITALLKGLFHFSEVKLQGLDLNLNTSNKVNPSPAFHRAEKQPPVLSNIQIERFLITQGNIHLKTSKKEYSLQQLQLGAEHINLNRLYFPLQLKATLSANSKDKNRTTLLSFKGKSSIDSNFIHNPAEALGHLQLDGQLSLQDIQGFPIEIENITGNMMLSQDKFVLRPLTFSLYSGASVGNLYFNCKDQTLKVNQTATNMNAEQISIHLFGRPILTGTVDLTLHLQTILNANIFSQLKGRGNLTVKNGQIQGVDFNALLSDLLHQIKLVVLDTPIKLATALAPEIFKSSKYLQGQTNFTLLSIPFSLEDHIIRSDSVLMQTDKTQIKGQGELNLDSDALKMKLFANFLNLSEGDEQLQVLLGGSFPLILSGTVQHPIIVPNLDLIHPLITSIFKPIKIFESVQKQ